MDIINKNIRTLRKLENIKSQSEFGDLIGVPSHNINKYENNVIPKPDVLRTIATTFNINLHLFLTRELTKKNYDDFKVERDTEIKLEGLKSEFTSDIEVKRGDVDRMATYFTDKLIMIEQNDLNEIDRQKLFKDLKVLFLAYHKKLKDFYEMQDRLSFILEGKGPPTQS